ncbi:MAG: MptD family putative ECF transporter S component [Deltaproteobacteria bacterium]|jgi:energy-coupling factor transport system substrate-specific component|nr:MptD family putative ECF transporter S component [Deltaproteobacteria bacterium]
MNSNRLSLGSVLNGQGLFTTRELVIIGLFSAAAKASSLMLALVGGGMNPATLILKSAVHSALLVVLLAKTPRTGALTLSNIIGILLSFLLMGQHVISLPAIVAATLLVETAAWLGGGLEHKPWLAIPMVAASELLVRFVNVGVAYLGVREQPGLMVMVVAVSAFSYLGILLGLVLGRRMTKELRHAGLIQD